MTRLSGDCKFLLLGHTQQKNYTLKIQHGTSKLLSLKMVFLFQVVSFRFHGSFLGSSELANMFTSLEASQVFSESPERSFLISLVLPISWFQHWLWFESWENCQAQQKLMAQMVPIPSAHPLLNFLCHYPRFNHNRLIQLFSRTVYFLSFPNYLFQVSLAQLLEKGPVAAKKVCVIHICFF